MLGMIKKLFAILSALPAFSNLFKKATVTGKIDPVEALNALSSLSPSTKKCADVALNTVNNGGGIPEVAKALTDVGEVEVMGQKLNTRTLTQDLKKAGGICSTLGNMIEKMQTQSHKDIVDLGNAATEISNWDELIKS